MGHSKRVLLRLLLTLHHALLHLRLHELLRLSLLNCKQLSLVRIHVYRLSEAWRNTLGHAWYCSRHVMVMRCVCRALGRSSSCTVRRAGCSYMPTCTRCALPGSLLALDQQVHDIFGLCRVSSCVKRVSQSLIVIDECSSSVEQSLSFWTWVRWECLLDPKPDLSYL